MVLNEGCSTMSMSGRSNLPPIEGITEQDRRSIPVTMGDQQKGRAPDPSRCASHHRSPVGRGGGCPVVIMTRNPLRFLLLRGY